MNGRDECNAWEPSNSTTGVASSVHKVAGEPTGARESIVEAGSNNFLIYWNAVEGSVTTPVSSCSFLCTASLEGFPQGLLPTLRVTFSIRHGWACWAGCGGRGDLHPY